MYVSGTNWWDTYRSRRCHHDAPKVDESITVALKGLASYDVHLF